MRSCRVKRYDARVAVQSSAESELQMEQHMYTYLNQKYGLKTLIVEHASSIIRAVHQFSEENNDVCVFGRILQ